MELMDKMICSFKIAKVFWEYTDRINDIDYSSNGESLISSGVDDRIMYDCERGIITNILHSKLYGVGVIKFTHAKNTVIHSSTKVNDTIRYLSLPDNKYIRYFPGHTRKVVSICISPVDDSFMSASLDKTLRLWDLRSPNCKAMMQLSGTPVTAFDPEGLIFAVGVNSGRIKLYDLRAIEKGPFGEFVLPEERVYDWTRLKFSPDRKSILISTNGPITRLICAFSCYPLQTFNAEMDRRERLFESSFSPDSKYIFSGSTDVRVHVWNAATGFKVCALNANHIGPVHWVQVNPKFMMLASAGTNMAFWLPIIQEIN